MFARRPLVALLPVGLLLVAAEAGAGFPGGTIVISNERVDTAAPDWEKLLKKRQKSELNKGVDGWSLFLVAYLNRSPGAEEVNLVFYEVTGKEREQVNHFPIATKPNAKIIASEVVLSTEQGFKAGGKYLVLITRLIDGKEVVYAKTNLALK
jgi:hypothetical protein